MRPRRPDASWRSSWPRPRRGCPWRRCVACWGTWRRSCLARPRSAMPAADDLPPGDAAPALGQLEHTVQAMAPSRWIVPLLCALAVVAWGIPVRATPDVPVFVGPASLEMEGTRGAWTWRDVRFGTDEIRARATLVPGGASCSVRLRVMTDGEPVAEASFHASLERAWASARCCGSPMCTVACASTATAGSGWCSSNRCRTATSRLASRSVPTRSMVSASRSSARSSSRSRAGGPPTADGTPAGPSPWSAPRTGAPAP